MAAFAIWSASFFVFLKLIYDPKEILENYKYK